MKTFLAIVCVLVVAYAFFFSPESGPPKRLAETQIIRLHVSGGSLDEIVGHINKSINAQADEKKEAPAFLLKLVKNSKAADVLVEYVDKLSDESERVGAFGETGAITKIVAIKKTVSKDQLYYTLMHEVGHAADLPDEYDELDSIMYFQAQTSGSIGKIKPRHIPHYQALGVHSLFSIKRWIPDE